MKLIAFLQMQYSENAHCLFAGFVFDFRPWRVMIKEKYAKASR